MQLLRGRASQIRVPPEDPVCEKIKPSTPVNVPRLGHALRKHPNRCFVNYLITGLVHGFFAGLSHFPAASFSCPNLLSARREPEIVDALLEKELKKGFMIGPFDTSPFSIFRINPIGVATRKYSGKKRLIIDLSAPHNGQVDSINDLIPLPPFSLFYSTVDDAIKLIKKAGKGAWLAKADVSDAFKVMPLHPSQWPLFGVKWRGKMFFSVRLTFGCRSSPKIFDTLAEALCWILLNNDKLPFVLHLLDDFLLVDFPSATPDVSISALKRTFSHLGIPLSEEKTIGPVKVIEFLGITLDSNLMQASLPAEKLSRIRQVMHDACASQSFCKRELLSLLGHLNFAMRVIPQGRSFVSRLLDLSKTVENLSDIITIDAGCRSEFRFWAQLLEKWNGISFFHNDFAESSPALNLYTDAAPSIGFGGVYNKQWFAGAWPAELRALPPDVSSTALLELYPIVIACLLWGKHWERKRIIFFCDNEATVAIINKGRSSIPFINKFMRRLTWLSITGNYVIRAVHIPGLNNQVADSLSRFNLQKFHLLCPGAARTSLECPPFSQTILD